MKLELSNVFEGVFVPFSDASTVKKMINMPMLGFKVYTRFQDDRPTMFAILAVNLSLRAKAIFAINLMCHENEIKITAFPVVKGLEDKKGNAVFWKESEGFLLVTESLSDLVSYTFSQDHQLSPFKSMKLNLLEPPMLI
jgi:hypothetical protein